MNNPLVIDVSDRSEVTFWCYVVEGDEVGVVAEFVDGDRPDPDDAWCRMTGEWIDDSNSDIGGGGVEVSDGVLAKNVGSVVAKATGYYSVTLSEIPATMSTVTVTFPREQNVSTEVSSSITGVRGSGVPVSKDLSIVAAVLPEYPVSIIVPDGLEVSGLVVANGNSRLAGETGHTLLISAASGSYSMWYLDGSWTEDAAGNYVATGDPDPAIVEGQFSDGVDFSSVGMATYSMVADNFEMSAETKPISDNEDYTLSGDQIVPIEKDIVWESESGVAAEWIQAAGTYAHPGIDYYPETVRAYEVDTSGEKHLISTVVAELVSGYKWRRWTATVPWNTNYVEYDVYGYYTMPTWNVPYTGKYNSTNEAPFLSGTGSLTLSQNVYSNATQATDVAQFGGGTLVIVQEENPDGEDAPAGFDGVSALEALGGNTAAAIVVKGGTMYPGTGGLYYGAGDVDEYSTFDRYQYGVLAPENGVIPLCCGLEVGGTDDAPTFSVVAKSSKVALVTEDTEGDIWLYVDWEAKCFSEDISLSLSKASNTLTVLTIECSSVNFSGDAKMWTVYVRPTAADNWLALTVVQPVTASGFFLTSGDPPFLDSPAASENTFSSIVMRYGFALGSDWTVEYAQEADDDIERLDDDGAVMECAAEPNGWSVSSTDGDAETGTGFLNMYFPAPANEKLARVFYRWKISSEGATGIFGVNHCYFVVVQEANKHLEWDKDVYYRKDGEEFDAITTKTEENDTPVFTADWYKCVETSYRSQKAYPDKDPEVVSTSTVEYYLFVYPEVLCVFAGGSTAYREASNYVGSVSELQFNWLGATSGTGLTLKVYGYFLHHYQKVDGNRPAVDGCQQPDDLLTWDVSFAEGDGEDFVVGENVEIELVDADVIETDETKSPPQKTFSTKVNLALTENTEARPRFGTLRAITSLGEFTGGFMPDGIPGDAVATDDLPTYDYTYIEIPVKQHPGWHYYLEEDSVQIGSAGGTVAFTVLYDYCKNETEAMNGEEVEIGTAFETTIDVAVDVNTSEESRTITGEYKATDAQTLTYTIIQAGAGVVYSLESSTGEIDQWGGEVEFTIVATSDATGEVVETLTRTATIDANPTLSSRTVTGTITAPDGTELEYSVEQAAATGYLDLAENTYYVGAEGGTITMVLQLVAETTGELVGSRYVQNILVAVAANESLEERTITGEAKLRVSRGDVYYVMRAYAYRNNTYTIIQSGATATYTITDGEGRTIGALGGTIEFTVEGVNDITGEVISTETYTVTVSENTSEESRAVTGTITVGDTALTWSVEQLGAGQAWLTATPDYVFLERPVAADIEIAVATENIEMDNIAVEVAGAAGEAVDWLAESSRADNGGGGFAFTFSASENTGAHARSATITLTDSGSGESVGISVLQAPTKTSMRIYIGRELFRGAIYLGRKRLKVF
ncbi:MAG: hypothetical protein LUD52_03375 [Opitutae bacterium]|nr:hypothetical protein [Opitutae bacterium]